MTGIEITGTLQQQAWVDKVMPPVEQVRPDMWSIPVPMPDNPLRYVLVYVLEVPDGVVLVDAGTASAAEVVAGSLRDRDRAVIIGSRTYGKGSVQESVRLADGSAIELTVGRYRTPGGRNLDGVGIEPDVAVSADRPPTVAEQRGRSVLRGLLATTPDKD